MTGVEITPVLLAGALAAAPIGALGLAIRRSTRRQECARLRDQLVDAARTGELDVADWRVFTLIDWFDQVATTGRTGTPGRHTRERPGPDDSLAHSLAATLLPLGVPGLVGSSWPQPPSADAARDLRATAISYRERHQQRRWQLPRRPARPRARVRVDITGLPRPDDALVPLTGWVPPGPGALDLREQAGTGGMPVLPPSLVEEIFAVAGSGR